MKRGKRMLAWDNEREKLKRKFMRWGITSCELRYPGGCWGENALGFAHAKKRRFLKPEELGVVVLSCNRCHDILESLPHALMEAEVLEVIRQRKKNLKKTLAFQNQMAQLSGRA